MNFIFQHLGRIPRNPFLLISSSVSPAAFFHIGVPLFAEPMKKKKKLDPALIRAREDRKRKRLEKSIKKLEKCTKQLKPLEETELPLSLKNEAMLRKRVLQSDIEVKFAQTLKPWADYCNKKVVNEEIMFQRISCSQAVAIKELRSISRVLHAQCLKIDNKLLPYSTSGPKSTAPIYGYVSLDGEWIDESKFK